MIATQSVWLLAAAALSAFGLAAAQAAVGSRAGSDHPAHAFLREGIRRNGGRLFITVPRLLNVSYCGAMPLYLHWILARLPTSAITWSERLLNPVINGLHTLLVAVIAYALAPDTSGAAHLAAWTAMLFALTPQFFHALSARNFGLSARGTGLLLLTGLLACTQAASVSAQPLPWWLAGVACGWLIWGFSTFAQQALVIVGALLLSGGLWQPALAALLGLLLFLAPHPRYSTSYLRHTVRFQRAYARELAPLYVLQRRPGVWRDLVWDIWRKPHEVGAARALLYAYENPVLVVLLTNPMALIAGWLALRGAVGEAAGGFADMVALAGIGAMLLTSFRPTRFLGEPERYVEAVTPWATIVAAQALMATGGTPALAAVALVFAIVDLAQLGASHRLVRHVATTGDELQAVADVADAALGSATRFGSNNEQLTKLLMGRDWQFAYFIAVGQDYAGMTATQAFSRFPFLRPEACERVAATYRLNCLLLDRQVYDRVFEPAPAGLAGVRVLYESPRFRLLGLDWAGA